jgi:hypothetical protein
MEWLGMEWNGIGIGMASAWQSKVKRIAKITWNFT